MIKALTHQEDIKSLNIYALSNRASKYMKHIGDFNTSLSKTYEKNRQKISKDIENMNIILTNLTQLTFVEYFPK